MTFCLVGGIDYSGSHYYQWWPETKHGELHLHLDHIIDYTGSVGGGVGAGKVYLAALSNESDPAAAPSFIFNSQIYFTDA